MSTKNPNENENKKNEKEPKKVADFRVWKQKQNLTADNIMGCINRSDNKIENYADTLTEEEKNGKKKKSKSNMSTDKVNKQGRSNNYVSDNVKKIMGDVDKIMKNMRESTEDLTKKNINSLLDTTKQIKKSEAVGETNSILKVKEKEYQLSLEGRTKKVPNYKYLADCYRKQLNKAFLNFNPLIHLGNIHMLRKADPEIDKDFQHQTEQIEDELKMITSPDYYRKQYEKKYQFKKNNDSSGNGSFNEDGQKFDNDKGIEYQNGTKNELLNINSVMNQNSASIPILDKKFNKPYIPQKKQAKNSLALPPINNKRQENKSEDKKSINSSKHSLQNRKQEKKGIVSTNPTVPTAETEASNSPSKPIMYSKKLKNKNKDRKIKFPDKDNREKEVNLMKIVCDKLEKTIDDENILNYYDNYKDLKNLDIKQQKHVYFGGLNRAQKIMTEIQENLILKNLDEDIRNRKKQITNESDKVIKDIDDTKDKLLREIGVKIKEFGLTELFPKDEKSNSPKKNKEEDK